MDNLDISTLRITPGVDFRVELLATVSVLGTLGDQEIESRPFSYPVTVCSDCVVNVLGDCPSTGAAPRTGNACNKFQDGVLDCCRMPDLSLVCPATTM